MEKFFIVTEKSGLNSEYWEYQKNTKELNQYVKKFMETFSIEAQEYSVSEDKFYIVPTDNDVDRFGKILSKALSNGLRAFRGNSKIIKEWKSYLKVNNVIMLNKPFAGIYFRGFGRCMSRLFHIDNILYCSYECEYDFNAPEGFTEIKASEFYKAIEDHNDKVRNDKAN